MFWRSCYCSSQTPHSAAQQSVHFTTSSACTIRRSSRKKHQATASFVLHTHAPATVHLSPSSDAWRETTFSVKLLFLLNLMQCERKNSQSHASSVSVKSENHSQKKNTPLASVRLPAWPCTRSSQTKVALSCIHKKKRQHGSKTRQKCSSASV